MDIKRGLLRYLCLRTAPITLIGIPLSSLYVATLNNNLNWPRPALLILVHVLLLTWVLAPVRSRPLAFLYTRGYSRDALWNHMMLTSLIAVLLTWLPAWIIMWTGLRALIQDRFFNYSIRIGREALLPLIWSGLYLVLFPASWYARIQSVHPSHWRFAGIPVSLGLVVAFFLPTYGRDILDRDWLGDTWVKGLAYTVCPIVSALLLVASRRLHRTMEIKG